MFVWVLILAFVFFALVKLRTGGGAGGQKPKTANKQAVDNECAPDDALKEDVLVEGAYQSKWMFSQNEKRAYYKLNEIAKKHDLIVFAKVRLFDLVEPIRNHPKYKSNLYRIQAKHVDFVLAKSNLVARYVIELDDNSHQNKERAERDEFVDKVLTLCGYKVFRTKEVSEEEILKFIES